MCTVSPLKVAKQTSLFSSRKIDALSKRFHEDFVRIMCHVYVNLPLVLDYMLFSTKRAFIQSKATRIFYQVPPNSFFKLAGADSGACSMDTRDSTFIMYEVCVTMITCLHRQNAECVLKAHTLQSLYCLSLEQGLDIITSCHDSLWKGLVKGPHFANPTSHSSCLYDNFQCPKATESYPRTK